MNRQLRSLFTRFLPRNRSGHVVLWWLLLIGIATLAIGLNGWWQRGRATAQDRPVSNDIWQVLERPPLAVPTSTGLPAQARVFRLNRAALVQALERAPLEFSGQQRPVLSLPLPDGTLARFEIEESPALEPGLAARFPEIKSYRGYGLDTAALTMRCDLSPRGFYAFIFTGERLINVQPVGGDDYVSFADVVQQDGLFECLTRDFHEINPGNVRAVAPEVAIGPSRRNYRIAIATTFEYTTNMGGGTVAGTVASLNTWLNGANVVYERELTVHLNLVNNTSIIYTTSADPYDNSNVGAMLNQVRPDLRDKVGAANYDVGHVLGWLSGTGGSGIAFVGVTCRNTDSGGDGLGPLKGGGATSVGGTVGNPTALGVWVHEIGHQFGANHSFNSTLGNCAGSNRNPTTAYESGSGSTIMSYSGICGADNIANTRDMRFHAGSYAQITSYLAGAGACFTTTATGNNAPTVNGGADFTIPRQTPFTLTATGSDPDAGDVPNLTYTWDQFDAGGTLYFQNGTAASYNDAADPSTTTRPIFRPFPASTSPSRTFPSLTYILNNANDPPDTVGGFQTAEELPRIGRSLNFRVMIRDNRAGGGGVNEDAVLLTVAGGAGPFLVTAPNTPVSWTGMAMQTVSWNVNGTNAAPVNTANVRILLSTDGGQTFPTVIAANTPNDGSETIVVPNVNTTTARIKVEAVGNIFFDISNTNFTITPGGGCPTITVNPATIPNGTAGTAYSQTFTQTGGTGTITWSFSGTLPPGLTLNSSTGVLSGTPTQIGNFNFMIIATGAGNCSGSRNYALTINCPTITVNPASLPGGTLGAPYSQSVAATPGGTTYSFAVTAGALPTGLSLNSTTGAISGTPSANGTFNFTVTATGFGTCTGSRAYSITIGCPTITVNPATLPNGTTGTPYSQTITQTGGSGTVAFSLSAGALPPGLTLSSGGVLSGTPTATGTFNFTVKATDANNCMGTRAYAVTINCATLIVNPATIPPGQINQAYSQSFSATGGTGAITFSASGTLPPGLTLNTSTGVLSGTPTQTGTFNFTITARDANTCTGSRAYALVISACTPLTVNPVSIPAGTVGAAYSQSFTATGGAGSYTFSLSAGSLPTGLSLSAAGVLSGTPAQAGTFNFTVRAADASNCMGTRAYTLVINCQTITINPPTLPNGTVGTPYNQTLTQTGGADTVSFTISAGALPPGLSLSASGVLSGTPSAAGTFNFTVRVAHSTGCTGTRAYTLTINQGAAGRRAKADFDGDRRTELSVWRGAEGNWYVIQSSNDQLQVTLWGAGYAPYNDVIVPGDYDGDGRTDHAIWRGSDSIWYIRKSSDGGAILELWGASYAPYFDIPTPGDFDGDGRTDLAVWRPTNGTFYVKRSSNGSVLIQQLGQQGDTPVPADYDGDGRTDFAVWRGSDTNWYILNSSGGAQTISWGAGYAPYFDVPVPADYDGDGKADAAIWRGNNSIWYIRPSATPNNPILRLWGANYAPYFDVPVPGDYDGDGRADIAVWRPTNGTWYVIRSTDGSNLIQPHGQQGDTPVPAHGVR